MTGIFYQLNQIEDISFIVFISRILLEVDYQAIVNRVATDTEVPLSDQTFAQAFQSARSTLDSLLK